MSSSSSSSNVTTEAGESAHEQPLPGFRFCPTPEVLVSYYLKMKIQGRDSKFKHLIREIDLLKFEPWDIPAVLGEPDVPDHEKVYIFFSRPYFMSNHSTRRIRTTARGFYKVTGKVRDIKARQSKDVIGKKKGLTFYRGRAPKAEKDDWLLDELSLMEAENEDFLLYRLKKQPANCKKPKEDSMCDQLSDSYSGEAGGGHIAYNSEDDQAAAATDMNLDSVVEHLAPREEGDVFNGNGNHDECHESPNESCLSNDVLTFGDEIDNWILSDFDFRPALTELLQEPLQPSDPRQPNSPPQPYKLAHPPQQPQPLSSPHIELANIPGAYNDDGSKVQSSFEDNNSRVTVTNTFSTNDQNVPIGNIAHNFQNGAADERIAEASFQPEDNLALYFPEFTGFHCHQ